MVETLLVREPFTLTNLSHEPLHGELRFQNDAVRKKPVLIICHSFMAFKDWGFFPHVGEQIAEKGFGAVTFNFSQNGVEDDENRITRFDRFEANTITREIEDLGAVIDAVADGRIGRGILDAGKLVLLGHSRGGGVAPGALVEVLLPGGGGYGPPSERDPELIARDLLEGYITRA